MPTPPPPPDTPKTKVTIVGKNEITSKRVVRSSTGAGAVYPPFLGVIRFTYPRLWHRMSNPL